MAEMTSLKRRRSYPKGYFEGLLPIWGTSTTIKIRAGSCRSRDDLENLILSESTLDISTLGALGSDQKTLSATASITNGDATWTASSSIISDLNGRTGSGTAATSGTAVSGTNSRFLEELAEGDVFGNATNGYAFVASIADNYHCTLAAALPGGDTTAAVYTIFEYPILWPGTTAADQKSPKTISADGLTIVFFSTIGGTTGSGKTIKLGTARAADPCFIHVAKGTSGTTLLGSTQRTQPYPVTGYSTRSRRIFSFIIGTSVTIPNFISVRDGQGWMTYAGYTRVLAAGTSTSYVLIDSSFIVPATATQILFLFTLVTDASGGGDAANLLAIGQNADGSNPYPALLNQGAITAAASGAGVSIWVPVTTSLAIYYKVTSASHDQLYADVYAYKEVLQ